LNEIGDNSFHIAGQVLKNEWEGRVHIELHGLDVSM
jgi:hypothetical protein